MNLKDVKPEHQIKVLKEVASMSNPEYQSVDALIEELTRIKQKAEAKGFDNLSIDVRNGYYDSKDWFVEGYRLETPEEARVRISLAEANDRRKEAARYLEYQKLKKEFES